MKYSTIVFDCDGVILDSNSIKTEAMRQAVSKYSHESIELFIDYHRNNGGISRYKKFEFFLKSIENNYSKEQYDSLLNVFASSVKAQLLDCAFTSGAESFIKSCSSTHNLYIVSGGDQIELREIFSERRFAKYFIEIFGSPISKDEHCKTIKKSNSTDSMLLIGDSRLDHEAARDNDIDFVFLSGYSDFDEWESYCHLHKIPSFHDFTALQAQFEL